MGKEGKLLSWWLILCLSLGAISAEAFTNTSFTVSEFNADSQNYFRLVGAVIQENEVLLTTSERSLVAGALWYLTPVFIRGMKTSFVFNISRNGDDSAHGVAFLIQNDPLGSRAVGSFGAGIGYASNDPSNLSNGIRNSLAVEFDCIKNDEMQDIDSPHISVHTRNSDYNSASEQYSLTNFNIVADFCSSATTAQVDLTYEPGYLTILISPLVSPPINRFEVKIEDRLSLLDFGTGYIGFTASTGDFGAQQAIKSWSYEFLGRLNATTSYASGSGLTKTVAGQQGEFFIYSADQYSNYFPFGGATIEVFYQGPSQVDTAIEDFQNGTYRVTYFTTVSGSYSLSILVNSVPIGTPSSQVVTISPAAAYGPTSKLLSNPPSATNAGTENSFTIELYDQYSNPRKQGGDQVTATLTPFSSRDIAQVIDNGDGTYRIRVVVYTAQSYQLSVTVGSEALAGSPFPLPTAPGPIDPKSCTITGFVSTYEAGLRETYDLTSFDAYGNRIQQGGATVTVRTVPSVATSELTVQDLGTGIYSIFVKIEKAQGYQLSILISGSDAAQSPYAIAVTPSSLSIPRCEAVGAGLTAGLAGVQSTFSIVTRDAYDNNIQTTPTTPFVVELDGPAYLVATTTNNPDGTVTVTYLPKVSGRFQTKITAAGVNIKNSPAQTDILPTEESASNTFVVDQDYTFLNGNSLEQTWLQVQIADLYGNKIQIGGHNVKANATSNNVKRPSITPAVTDNQNGTYTITFIPREDQYGNYNLTILLNGENIKDSPFLLDIQAVSKKDTILLAVGLSVVGICAIALVGLVAYRRYRKRVEYSQLNG